MAVEPDSAVVRFPPPFVYLGALLLGWRQNGSSPCALSALTSRSTSRLDGRMERLPNRKSASCARSTRSPLIAKA
jgi:hypothetical protein